MLQQCCVNSVLNGIDGINLSKQQTNSRSIARLEPLDLLQLLPDSSLRRFNSSLKAFFADIRHYFKSKQQCRLWGINVLFKLY